MTVQICQKMRGMGGMASKKKRIRPFRVLAMLMGAGTLAMLMRFPAKAVSLERQQAQLVKLTVGRPSRHTCGTKMVDIRLHEYIRKCCDTLLDCRRHTNSNDTAEDDRIQLQFMPVQLIWTIAAHQCIQNKHCGKRL